MSLKIALAQTNIHFGNPQENLRAGLGWIEKACDLGCNLVLFPELWTTGYDLESSFIHSKTNQEIIAVVQKECHRKNIAVGGSYITRNGDQFRNSFLLIDSAGNLLPQYDKLHLMKLFNEDKCFSAGNKIQVNSFSWGKAGLSICYDLRFPEIYRIMAFQQSAIFLLVAEWPLKRIDHWNTLLKARAIENQVFVAAVNCVGTTGLETLGGSSRIISPWGDVLAYAESNHEQLITQEIDLADIWEYRKTINILQDCRKDLY